MTTTTKETTLKITVGMAVVPHFKKSLLAIKAASAYADEMTDNAYFEIMSQFVLDNKEAFQETITGAMTARNVAKYALKEAEIDASAEEEKKAWRLKLLPLAA